MSKQQTQDTDDLDLGIDVSTLSDAEKPIYEKLNAQVRKAYLDKTQKLATQRKTWEEEQAKIKADHEEATKALQAWNNWWQTEGQYMTKAEQRAAMAEEGLEEPNALMKEIKAIRQEFAEAEKRYGDIITKQGDELKNTQRALGLHNQLLDIRLKHPDADTNRIIETAKERGIQDLDLAYQLAYGDEIRDKEVEEKVTARLTEEREKAAAEKDIVDTKPSTTKYAPPPEAKSYGEASNNLLGAVRKSGGLFNAS
jgi:hypothetical protein